MTCPESALVTWLLATVQFVGLASAWLARLSEGTTRQVHCQRLFLGSLAAIGLATMLTSAMGVGYWLSSGATLSVMVLAAIWDFSPHARPEGL